MRRWLTAISVVGTVLLSTLLALSPGAGATSRTAAGASPTDLGEPVPHALALSSGFGTAPDGAPQAYYLFEGNATTTAEFVVVDVRSKAIVLDTRLPHGTSSARTLDFSAADGNVYFAADDSDVSYLYRYQPGSSSVDYLGTTLTGQRTWSLFAAQDGTIWGGTYPGGRLFSYTPSTGQIHDYGQAIAGEQYISSITQVGDRLYVGTQPHGLLAQFDPATGTFSQIALPADAESTGIDELYLRRNLLFAGTEGGKLLVRDLNTNSWVDEITDFSGRGVSPVDPTTG
ncbi:MAG: hypothetical protein J2P17_20545, partial [Mycobacterium sp.]|nr:hypothetical protein [Mycobacterium sp.]